MSVQPRTPKRVTVIQPTEQYSERDFYKKHLRVAPYCRVSSKKDEQLNSYEAQIEYYTEKVNENPDWTMVRLYADEGITGTSTRKRKQFNQMIRDCEKGKIDLVITKSVSRFCRNTLDGLDYIRRLKRHGVGVLFEKENVNTLYMDNEMILTFMMSQAQAESESLSSNVKWGHRKNFMDGKVYYHYDNFLGYRKGPDGQPVIDEEQAAVVRRIFARYLMGHSTRRICADLMADGLKTARGSEKWSDSSIRGILRNEKYVGDALLQKTYSADLFTHQQKKNNGELPKYYVHECHPAIIDRATFQKVQEEIVRRTSIRKTSSRTKTELGKFSGKYVLADLLVCSECGSPYRRVLWMPGGVKRYVWRCINRLEHGKRICKCSPTLEEPDLHAAVVSAMNEMFSQRIAKETLRDCIADVLAGEEKELTLPAIESQLKQHRERQFKLFELAAGAGVDCTDYDEDLHQVNLAITKLMAKKVELEHKQQMETEFQRRMNKLGNTLDQSDSAIDRFDEVSVRQLISNIRVISKEQITVRFRDGTEIEQSIENGGDMKTA